MAELFDNMLFGNVFIEISESIKFIKLVTYRLKYVSFAIRLNSFEISFG